MNGLQTAILAVVACADHHRNSIVVRLRADLYLILWIDLYSKIARPPQTVLNETCQWVDDWKTIEFHSCNKYSFCQLYVVCFSCRWSWRAEVGEWGYWRRTFHEQPRTFRLLGFKIDIDRFLNICMANVCRAFVKIKDLCFFLSGFLFLYRFSWTLSKVIKFGVKSIVLNKKLGFSNVNLVGWHCWLMHC